MLLRLIYIFKLPNHIREPVLAVWFASKLQILYSAFYTRLYKNTIKVKREEYSGGIMLLEVSAPIMCWFSVSDVTCGDLWDLQFIARKQTKLLPVSYRGSLEQRVTYVSIVCLSVSSDHVLERWLFMSRIFLGVAVNFTKQVIYRKAHDY